MNGETNKALRNLRVGGVYTPIVFGIIFLVIPLLLSKLDPSGELSGKYHYFFGSIKTAGGMLLFFGINTYIYFQRYLKSLKKEFCDFNQ